MGGVSRELALQIKGLCQTVEHLVDGAAQLLKLPNGAFVKAQGRDAVLIDLFRLTGELPKRLQGAAGDEIGDGRAEQGHDGGDDPALVAVKRLGVADLLRKMDEEIRNLVVRNFDGQTLHVARLILHDVAA